MEDNILEWNKVGSISTGFTTEVMRVPGGFMFRCIGNKETREDQPTIAMQFVPVERNFHSPVLDKLNEIVR